MTIALVNQVTSAVNGNLYQTESISMPSVSAGQGIIVYVWLFHNTPSVPTITDDKGNGSYASSGFMLNCLSDETIAMFYMRTGSSGTHVVTLDKNSTAYGCYFVGANYSGILGSGAWLDTANYAVGNSVSLTTTADNDMLTALGSSNTTYPFQAGGSRVEVASPNLHWYSSCEYIADAGAQGAGKVISFASGTNGMIAAAFKAAGGGGGGSAPTITSTTPTNGFVDSTQHIAIVGTNLAGATLTWDVSTGLTINNPVATSTSYAADIAIASSAPTTTRTGTLTAAGGTVQFSFTVRGRGATGGSTHGGVSPNGNPFLSVELLN